MNEGDALDLVQSAIWMVVVGAGPCVGAAMAVGVVIALLQALTQMQEMTLTFVPKMIVVFLVVEPHGLVHRGSVLDLHRAGLRADRAGVQIGPKRLAAATRGSTLAQGSRPHSSRRGAMCLAPS